MAKLYVYLDAAWKEVYTSGAPASIDHGALTGLADDDHTQYILKTLADAQSVLAAVSDDTPVAIVLGEQTLLGRITGGNVVGLTVTQILTLLNVEAGATKYPDTGEQAFLDADHSKLDGIEASAVALATVKADSDIADAISKKHTAGTDTALGAVGAKNPPIDADKAIYRDSTASDALVTSTWTQIKAFLKTYFDGLYGTGGGTLSEVLGFVIMSLPDSHGLYADATGHELRIRTSLAVAGDNLLVTQGYTWIGSGLRVCW